MTLSYTDILITVVIVAVVLFAAHRFGQNNPVGTGRLSKRLSAVEANVADLKTKTDGMDKALSTLAVSVADTARGVDAMRMTNDPHSTVDDIVGYGLANGFKVDRKDAERFVADRAKGVKASQEVVYKRAPRVLTDPGDGTFGATMRGVGDPLNVLDELGAVVDSLGGTEGRENLSNSDRRCADIWANNVDQNRSILANDDAEHPYARFGGQLASGLALPTVSLEGVGLNVARATLRAGGTRMAAVEAAEAAVRRRLAAAGGAEGAVIGSGGAEGGWAERAKGAAIGAPIGAALGFGTAGLAQRVGGLVRGGRGGRASRAAVAGEGLDPAPVVSREAGPVEAVTPAAAADTNVVPPITRVVDDVADMANDMPRPTLDGPRVPDHIDLRQPRQLLQSATPAQRAAQAEEIKSSDVLPLTLDDELPDLAGNIRLDNLHTPQDIRRALTVTDQRVGGFDAARRGEIAFQETERLASDLGMTPADLLARQPGQALNAEQALAARQILARSGDELVSLARRVQGLDNPGDELLGQFRQAWLRHVAIQEQVAGATAEAGRALAQFRIKADSRAARGVLPAFVEGGGGASRLRDAADMIANSADDPGALNAMAARALKPKFKDKLVELWYNS
jgi:hypothetical protein